MKILLSAYACEPGKGSEPEVGLRTLLAAAREHDVWVLTRENNLPGLEAYLQADPREARIHLIGLDVPGPILWMKKRHAVFSHLYYDQWQRAAAARATELDQQIGFDLIHHVTFAAYWKRAGTMEVLNTPFVWGPIGGGVHTPWRLARHLGLQGMAEEALRAVVRPMMAMLPPFRRAQRRAAHVLVQNTETAERINTRCPITVLPNALGADVPDAALSEVRRPTIAVVGNLIAWKAVDLALDAFVAADLSGVRLVIVGDGPLRRKLTHRARAIGVDDRVTFLGEQPRDEVLRIIGASLVLLHPALHEEAGWVVAEALSLGTPVVCLDRGGPPELLRQWPDTPSAAVAIGSWPRTADALGCAVRRMVHETTTLTEVRTPVRRYDRTVLDVYGTAAAATTAIR